ncbi:MAG TPA: DUF5985 family protein [Candidatus Kapabacteria bacterium]|nr:DUF5985 family protein [Candidatus Kapabacteria bacterium]
MTDTYLVNDLISGALIMGYFVAALFFMKFYRATKDRLFALFSTAFWILCAQRTALALTTRTVEDATIFYVIRLVAFLIILYAIIDKNVAAKRVS